MNLFDALMLSALIQLTFYKIRSLRRYIKIKKRLDNLK